MSSLEDILDELVTKIKNAKKRLLDLLFGPFSVKKLSN